MGAYAGFWRNIRRAPRFFDRRVHTRPSLGDDARPEHVVRADRRHRGGPEGPWLTRLLGLVWPAPLVAGVPLFAYHAENFRFWSNDPWFLALCVGPFVLVATVRALTASDTRGVRYIAALLNAAFPLYLGVTWLLTLV